MTHSAPSQPCSIAGLSADEVRDVQSLDQQLAAVARDIWPKLIESVCPVSVSVRIEMDRGAGWETRQAGELTEDRAATIATINATLPAYCVQYPHRALVDGVVVAETRP